MTQPFQPVVPSANAGTVQIAYLHDQDVSHSFMDSMRRMWHYDRTQGGNRIAELPLNIVCGAGRLVPSRNYAARLFLDKTPHEWLMFIDSDMGFAPDAVHALLEVADPVERPIVGGLCFAAMLSGSDGMGGFRQTIVPTMYGLGTAEGTGRPSFHYWGPYPADTVVRVAGTGAAFLLIHRSVLEAMRVKSRPGGDHWFDMLYDPDDDTIGEDIAFCLRAVTLGFPIHVHTGVRTTHHKAGWLAEDDYLASQGLLRGDPDLPVLVHVAASLATLAALDNESEYDGLRMWKLPADLNRYATIIEATKPDVIVETGTKWGGSARWFENCGVDVVTVDIDGDPSQAAREVCERTTFIVGDSIDPATVARVTELVAGRRVMVSLDSEHAAPHVAAEIAAYGPLVSPGCYLVVEDAIFDLATDHDTQVLGGGLIPEVGGPLRAIKQELYGQPGWTRDSAIEAQYPVSHHPAGWWRRDD